MDIAAVQAGMYFRNCWLSGILSSHTTISSIYRQCSGKKEKHLVSGSCYDKTEMLKPLCLRSKVEMERLIWDARKTTADQTTSRYNQAMQSRRGFYSVCFTVASICLSSLFRSGPTRIMPHHQSFRQGQHFNVVIYFQSVLAQFPPTYGNFTLKILFLADNCDSTFTCTSISSFWR